MQKRFLLSLLFLGSINYYLVAQSNVFIQYGDASFYADKFEGRTTASGEKYTHTKLTAAHLTLPFGTMVKVTNVTNNKSVIVRINDRGPFVEGRIIDLSKSAAMELDYITLGVVRVKVEVVNENDPGTDDNPKPPQKPNKEFYDFQASRTKPAGYGVQIGSYAEFANLMRISETLKTTYKNEVTVQVTEVNKTKVYRVIAGSFSSRAQAENLQKKLKKDYPDCFVVGFDGL
ncbi:MAG: septal ring lytic transglycosylase RlpA family protein [Bacteroidales bacterium]|nr:septal ring lytic transglycosylase RlpA family protein [Bacteroidales bacterium]